MGNHTEELKKLVGKANAKVAVCVNASDGSDDVERKAEGLARELEDMRSLGFEAEQLDLREYFGKSGLAEKMKSYDLIWVRGGNTFLLAKAFRQSGFDKVFADQVVSGGLVYAGYSAAFCVLNTSLRGVELVDDKDAQAEGYEPGEIWEGLGVIDFYPIVHFRSDHHESELVEKEYEFVVKNNIPHKTFKDGDVYLVNGSKQRTLS